MTEMPKYTKKDFVSDQAVRWCPGCGDYSILAAIQMVMPRIGKRKEDLAFIAGIGCSSRFPYYMNTYGMHTIHGRAPAFATGLKSHNPHLSVWVTTGDGDGLSIGGNHTIHTVRRNVDLNVILHNNRIYGLTKGQYSPTSEIGKKTKSTPFGSIDRPFEPAQVVLGANATFFARTIDTDVKHMQETFLAAAEHKGLSFVEVLQNCNIFNDGAHTYVSDRVHKDDHSIKLEHGKPLIFGKERDKGLVVDGVKFKVVEIGKNGITEDNIHVHDAHAPMSYSHMLTELVAPDFPIPLGVFRAVQAPCYDEEMEKQIKEIKDKKGVGDVQKALEATTTWKVD